MLVLCPKPLVTDRKWERELKRFDEDFTQLDGTTLRHCIKEADNDGVWPIKYSKVIVPLSLLDGDLLEGDGKKRIGLEQLDPSPHFDLVICDEAHHLRNPNTFVHRGVQFFCDNAEAVVFLTATPVQLGSDDLFVLLRMLRPDIIDRAAFDNMAIPNRSLNRALDIARAAGPNWQEEMHSTLIEAAASDFGRRVLLSDPAFLDALVHLKKPLDNSDRLSLIRQAEDLRPFSRFINRSRRRDIGTFFTVRAPETISIAFTPRQQVLHDALLDTQRNILSRVHDTRNIMFLMTTIRRQAASCLHGLVPLLHEILTRRDLASLSEDSDYELPDEGDLKRAANSVADEVRMVLSLATDLDDYDPKWEALRHLLTEKQHLANNKALLFSTFRHTLTYLLARLREVDMRVGLIHGAVSDEQRLDLRHRFSLPKSHPNAIDVLLSSEVGCEGLDYEFCDCLVNYDIPWNPMRVEQRIGRIDRYGQQSEKVLIYNFVTPGTVEFDIYDRCLMRIGVFRDSLGGSKEILGEIAQGIESIADNLQLTEDERRGQLNQLMDNKIRLQQEQDNLEKQQGDLFGLALPPGQAQRDDIDAVTSPWLTPQALDGLVETYLEAVAAKGQNILGEQALRVLRASQDTRARLLADFKTLDYRPSPIYRDWEKWLKGGDQHLNITFDDTCASNNRAAVFITPVHPLALQAARAHINEGRIYTAFRVQDDGLPSNTYPFAVYQWQKQGIRPDVILQPVCQVIEATDAFMRLLCRAEPIDINNIVLPDKRVFDQLERQHYDLWLAARQTHREETAQLAVYRRESLRVSHTARMSQLQEALARATNEKIRRIPLGEIRNAEADFERRQREVDQAESGADIVATAVAYGLMIVEGV